MNKVEVKLENYLAQKPSVEQQIHHDLCDSAVSPLPVSTATSEIMVHTSAQEPPPL